MVQFWGFRWRHSEEELDDDATKRRQLVATVVEARMHRATTRVDGRGRLQRKVRVERDEGYHKGRGIDDGSDAVKDNINMKLHKKYDSAIQEQVDLVSGGTEVKFNVDFNQKN
eukprot:Gb_24822 [translate_table: standard]